MMPLSSNRKPFHRRLLFGLVLGAGLTYWLLQGPLREESSPHSPLHETQQGPALEQNQPEDPHAAESLESFVERVMGSLSQPQVSPEDTEAQIQAKALQLNALELRKLKAMALNTELNQDQRFAAAYLLSFSELSESLAELYEIAQTPWSAMTAPRHQEFERALRAYAVEAMGLHPEKTRASQMLDQYLKKESDSFLFDRARRTSDHLQGKAPHPKLQDEAALRKLLQTER